MSHYLNYPDKKIAPSRMTRKRARRDVFMKNKKSTKLAREARLELRLLREAARLQQDAIEQPENL